MDVLIEQHVELWEQAVRVWGLARPEVVKEIRCHGEPCMPVETAAGLLADHAGLTRWASLEEGWSCAAVAATVAQHLRSNAAMRLRRGDWMALLELCLGSEPTLADVALGRVDHSTWPPFIEAMGERKGPPSLLTLCARAIAREPAAFPRLTPEQARLVKMHSAGVGFDSARLSEHDPIPGSSAAACRQQLRSAQLCSRWPHRLLRLAGKSRRVHQRPAQGLGTGACIWGGALALCDDLEARGQAWMEGKRVVELGAGTAVVSLCAALLGAAAVVSTDLPVPIGSEASGESLLDLIERNAAEHRHACPSPSEQRWRAAPLLWGDEDQVAEVLTFLGGCCDVVLASEVAYDSSCFDVLLRTIAALCAPGRASDKPTVVLMCHYPRTQAGGSEPELREFERRAKAVGFDLEVCPCVGRATGVNYEKHVLRLSSPAWAAT